MGCAATTTIREVLEYPAAWRAYRAGMGASEYEAFLTEKERADLAALASLEQLVEAAREVVGHSDAAFVRLSAALAAVGPGEETG